MGTGRVAEVLFQVGPHRGHNFRVMRRRRVVIEVNGSLKMSHDVVFYHTGSLRLLNMLDWEAQRFPVRKALLQTERIETARPQQCDGLVREHAVRTPAVCYDLP